MILSKYFKCLMCNLRPRVFLVSCNFLIVFNKTPPYVYLQSDTEITDISFQPKMMRKTHKSYNLIMYFGNRYYINNSDDDGVQVVQVFLRRQEIPVSKVERYVLPHISSLFHHHIIFNQKVTNLWLVLHAFLHFRALVICHSIFSNLFY